MIGLQVFSRSYIRPLIGLTCLFLGLPLLGATKARSATLTNIAPQTSYTISPRPNYPLAKGNSRTVLNDKKRGWGRLWTSTRAIGWQRKSPIVYRQKFRRETPISKIEIGTVANKRSDIYLPDAAFVYAADKHGRFVYLGDVAARSAHKKWPAVDNVRTLKLSFKAVRTREVMIVFYRKNTFLFLDEVRILASRKGRYIKGSIKPGQVLAKAAQRRRTTAEARSKNKPLGTKKAERFAWPLPHDKSLHGAQNCRAQAVNAWTESTPEAILAARPATASFHASGGWLTGAIRLVNNTNRACAIKISTKDAPKKHQRTKTYVAHYVQALNHQWYADVLVPRKTLTLPPNSFALMITRKPVHRKGAQRSDLQISLARSSHTINIKGHALDVARSFRPYGNLWSYLTGPTLRTAACWPRIHDEFWIDTVVIPQAALSPRANSKAAQLFRTYLRRFRSARRILLWPGLKHQTWLKEASEKKMHKELKNWWQWVKKILKEENVRSQIVIYPMDEPTAKDLPRLTKITRIFRKIAANTPLYATIGNAKVLQGSSLDIVQLHEELVSRGLTTHKTAQEIQTYSVLHHAKTAGLNNKFRRISWTGFANKMSGVGAWSMWDSNGAMHPKNGWSDFGGTERDFGLLYADQGQCTLASRRLLAFQRGLEDFSLLNVCATKNTSLKLRNKITQFLSPDLPPTGKLREFYTSTLRSCFDKLATGMINQQTAKAE